MSIFKRESLFALLAASVFIGGCGGGGGGGGGNANSGGGGGNNGTVTAPDTVIAAFQVAISDKNTDPENQVINTLVNFDGLTFAGKEPMTYQWDFGDGSTAQTKAAPHRFTQGGSYQVTFKAIDADGKAASKTIPWKVSNASIRFVAGSLDGSHHINGTATQARFNAPSGVAVTAGGIIYVVEPDSKLVRKVLPDGTTSDFAGAAYAAGESDGVGANARFQSPTEIATDGSGNLYVIDQTRLRKISPDGQVTTIASSDISNGYFYGIAADRNGAVFTFRNGILLKIFEGKISNFVGKPGTPGQVDGSADVALLNYPFAVTIDSSDNLYVAELCADVRKITPNGTVSSVRRSVIGSNPSACPFQMTNGIAVSTSGQLFRNYLGPGAVAEIGQVEVLDNQGNWTLYAGTAATQPGEWDGARNAVRFSKLKAIAAAPTGELIVTGGSHTIRRIPAAGNVTRVAGEPDSLPGVNLDNITFPSGSRVAKYMNGTMVATDGNCVRTLQTGQFAGVLAGNCSTPGYVDNSNINSRFSNLSGIAVDSSNNVFVTQSGNHVIRKIDTNGDVTTYAGVANTSGQQDGAIASATFNGPTYLTVDSTNSLWVVESNNTNLRKIAANGTVSTISIGSICSSAYPEYCSVSDIAADKTGSVFISTSSVASGKAIFKISSNGQISKLPPPTGYVPNMGDSRLAVSPQGDLWEIHQATTTPRDGYHIRRFDSAGVSIILASVKSFLAQVYVGQPEIEFTRPVDAAAFNADGTLMMIGGSTAFQASGLQ